MSSIPIVKITDTNKFSTSKTNMPTKPTKPIKPTNFYCVDKANGKCEKCGGYKNIEKEDNALFLETANTDMDYLNIDFAQLRRLGNI
jgi:hypothetical protein